MKNFMTLTIRRLVHALCLTLLVALAGCATEPQRAWHAFSFNGWYDNWNDQIDLLEYSYGQIHDEIKSPEGKLNSSGGETGYIPVGDFLYVKWRIKATSEVCEDKIDLRPLLPKNMNDYYGLTFVIDGKQLYVYVVTPKPRDSTKPQQLKTFLSKNRITYEIYPRNTFSSH